MATPLKRLSSSSPWPQAASAKATKGRVKWRWRFMWSVLLVLSGEALLEGWNTLAGDSWES